MADEQRSVDGSIIDDDDTEVVLEGWMLKLSRGRQWQQRYVTLHSNHVLSYSHSQDGGPRQRFYISRDTGCEVGEVYVEQRQKGNERESLYCVTISWPDDSISDPSGSYAPPNVSKLAESANNHNNHNSHHPREEPHLERARSVSPKPRALSPVPRMPRRLGLPFKTPQRSGKNARRHSGGWDSPPSERRMSGIERQLSGSYSLGKGLDADEASINSVGTPQSRSIFRGRKSLISKRALHDELRQSLPNIHLEFSKAMKQMQSRGSPAVPTVVNAKFTSDDHLSDGEVSPDLEYHHSSAHPTLSSTQEETEQEMLHAMYVTSQRKEKKATRRRMVEGTKIAVAATAIAGVGVLTAGVGLGAGLVALGATAAAGGTAGAAEAGFIRKWQKSGKLTIATSSYEGAKLWKATLEACLEFGSLKDSTWGQMFVADGRKTSSVLMLHDVDIKPAACKSRENTKVAEAKKLETPNGQTALFLRDEKLQGLSATWRPLQGGWTSFLGLGSQSLRIFRVATMLEKHAVGGSMSPLKTQTMLRASPLDAFLCLMSNARLLDPAPTLNTLTPNSGQTASFRLLEHVDDQTDIIHLIFRPLYLFPSWTEPRDFVLFRYWRFEPDGSYIICYESVKHPDCPPIPGFVRGVMHQVYTIAPAKSTRRKKLPPGLGVVESLLTAEVQVDPKGWVPTQPLPFLSNQNYADAFAVNALLQVLDIRDAISKDLFLDASPDIQQNPQATNRFRDGFFVATREQARANDAVNYDLRFANAERFGSTKYETISRLASSPSPLKREKWAEPDANSFLVRGPTYKSDRVKINAGASIGRLIAVDVVLVDKPILSGMSVHPKERIQVALQREKKLKELGKKCDMPPFIFVINIILPGPPFYHGVFYYAVDDYSTIDGTNGTPTSKLCNKFLFGDSDAFRDKTFKLIPQIVEGNFMVRKAVGSTPAIMGTKLQQRYIRHSRYMEIVLNCGSSAVATGVIRLSLGYAKTLVIDMGFLLEADESDFLPERIFGCVRMKYPEFGPHLRKVEPPEEVYVSL
eukprot:Nitzschia sp. Nitz4//scaffold46_size129759//57584//60679//NITZ4_003502-RA/size129759-processed-gene-0.224-mRNA-1//-1//CDS//3329552598//2984//frame0